MQIVKTARMLSMKDKCANCGRLFGDHAAKGSFCPVGRKDRTGGYTFHRSQKFLKKEQGRG